MLRLVVWMLLLANAAYFAWTQGYLGPLGLAPAEQSEPERLRAQVKPETLRLLNGPKGSAGAEPATPASDPTSPAPPVASAPAGESSGPAPVTTAASTATVATATATAGSTTVSPPAPATPAPERSACWLAGGFTTEQADALRTALSGSNLPRNSWQLSEARTGGRWVVYMGRYNDEQLDKKKGELKELGVGFRALPPPLGPALALGTYSSEEAAQQGLQDVTKKGVRTARVVQERAEGSAWTLRLPALTDAQRATVTGPGAPLAGKKLQPCD